MEPEPIHVTRTSLPVLEDYVDHLKDIWESERLTNHGGKVQELEASLAAATGVKHALCVANGTIALQLAVRALHLEKTEIVASPFSYIASVSSLLWEDCQVTFADILPGDLTIDPMALSKSITDKTRAIIPTHVYGFPCEVDAIGELAESRNLRVIYDASHCWGVRFKDKSIFQYGDIATLSLHATKPLQSGEGGVIFTDDDEAADRIKWLRNFGHTAPDSEICGLGINGKLSELHAALGLCSLKMSGDLLQRRKDVAAAYDDAFSGNAGVIRPKPQEGTERNFAYYSVLLESGGKVEEVVAGLKRKNIFPRRYFRPGLNRLGFREIQPMPVSEDTVERVLCLPLSAEMKPETASGIAAELLGILEGKSGSST